MIAACPRCSTRFRVGAERLRDEGVRLRCSQCQAVFRVYPPRAAVPKRRDDPAVEAELTPPPRPPERERMVLVADPDAMRGKASVAELGRLGLHPILVHDGVEALLTLQRSLPSRLVLDVELPRLSGAELCEVVKRNESLCSMHVVLTGRSEVLSGLGVLRAAGLGPDAVLEHPDLPDALAEALRLPKHESAPPAGIRHEVVPPPAHSQPGSVPEPQHEAAEEPAASVAEPFQPPAASIAQPPAQPAVTDAQSADPELERAERLARIIVSDIVLYNAERFDRAVSQGNVLEAMAGDLEEGRTLFRQRLPEEIWSTRDFLAQEMERVARSRTRH